MHPCVLEELLKDKDGFSAYKEDDFITLSFICCGKKCIIHLENREDACVIWYIEVDHVNYKEVFDILLNQCEKDLIFPFVDDELDAYVLKKFGAEEIDFEDDDCDDYCHDFGSFIIKRSKK